MQNLSTRKKNVYINSIVTLITQVVQIIIGFGLRRVFIVTLGVSFLGYNSVFTNILQMLNLADLGIGVAITSFLFKPLAEKNFNEISILMTLYKKIYTFIGTIVAVLGICVSFFLPVLIPDATCSTPYLTFLFYLNLFGTVSTYFLAYKRTLLIADQKAYIAAIVDFIVFLIVSFIQIFLLLYSPNYVVYLILNIGKSIVANIILSYKVNNMYGKIYKNSDKEAIANFEKDIYKYVKDVFVSRIGATVFYGTDSVIISIFKGSISAGYLSNYTMITTQLTSILGQLFASIQGTFGNYVNSDKSIREQESMTNNYLFINYLIGNVCLICFSMLAQPFVELIFGKDMLLSFSTVLWLGLNLLLSMLLQLPSQLFVVYKLYKYDRPIIILSAILNILISACLVNVIGINGVLIGTFFTSLIYIFSRFYVVSKIVYKNNYRVYISKILKYFFVSFVSFISIYFVTKHIICSNFFDFAIKCIFVGVYSISLPILLLSHTKEYIYFKSTFIPYKLSKYISTFIILLLNIFLTILVFIFI